MTVRIRKAVPADGEPIRRMHGASIRELCRRSYTSGQIGAWVDEIAMANYVQGMAENEFFVAEEKQGDIAGFIIFSVRSAEIHALYLLPGAVGNGLGRQLFDLAENLIRNQGHEVIRLKATLNAVGFYERMGFCRGSFSTHKLSNGEALPCLDMKKELNGGSQSLSGEPECCLRSDVSSPLKARRPE